MSQFSFPVLSLDEVLDSLDFVKKSDYEKPECQRWFKIYSIMFQSITGVRLDSIEGRALLSFAKNMDYENPELFDDASRKIWFTLALQRAFITCGVQDFTFKDVRDPRPKRLLVISSACINFLRFKASQESLIQDVLEKRESSKMRSIKAFASNEELKNKLEIALKMKAKREPDMAYLMKETEEIKDKMASIHGESLEHVSAIAEMKAKATEIRASNAQKKCEIVKVKQKCDKLQQNIVQSPEKVREKINLLKERVEKVKEVALVKVSTATNHGNRLSQMNASIALQGQTLKLFVTMEDDLNRAEEIKEESKKVKETKVMNAMKMKALQLQESDIKELLVVIQERSDKFNTQKRVRMSDFEASYPQNTEQTKAERESLDKYQLKKREVLSAKQNLLDEVREAWMETNIKHDIAIQKYSEMLEELDKYHLFLKKSLIF